MLSLHGCKSQKESLDQDKKKLERNFENCATNLVKMNYRLASVFSYERFGNALICIISIGPSTRHDQVEADSQLSYFRKNGASLELLRVSLPKTGPLRFGSENQFPLNFAHEYILVQK